MMDLDEFTEIALRRELEKRAALRERGLCDYCARPHSEPPCRFKMRHAGIISPQPIIDKEAT